MAAGNSCEKRYCTNLMPFPFGNGAQSGLDIPSGVKQSIGSRPELIQAVFESGAFAGVLSRLQSAATPAFTFLPVPRELVESLDNLARLGGEGEVLIRELTKESENFCQVCRACWLGG